MFLLSLKEPESKESDGNQDKSEYSDAFSDLKKDDIIEKAKCFNDKKIQELLCKELLTKIIYLLNHGESFSEKETTDLFFGVTKLYQSNEIELRRLIYVFIKEMKVRRDEIFIVQSSLTKDILSPNPLYKANAIKVLSKVIDQTSIQSIERYIKILIQDKNPYVVSSALVYSIMIYPKCSEFVQRWSNDIHELLNSQNNQVLYLALILISILKSQDPIALSRIILNQTKQQNYKKNPLALSQLIRYIKTVLLNAELNAKSQETLIQFLESCLNVNVPEMAQFEAAKAMIEVHHILPVSLNQTFSLLQVMSNSNKSYLKYAALRLINKIAIDDPQMIMNFRSELESLINFPNRSVASIAITILLKICKEADVSSLLTTIHQYMPDIGDEFKVDIIKAISSLAERHPNSCKVLLEFLKKCLRPYIHYEFKNVILDTIQFILSKNSSIREDALQVLVEFIEDCPFDALLSKGLLLLSSEAIKSPNTSSFLKFICNRLILESEQVRATAISDLAKMAFAKPEIKSKIIPLLKKCQTDISEEVRDRAIFYLNALNQEENVTKELLEPSPIDVELLDNYIQQNLSQFLNNDKLINFDLSSITFQPKEENPIINQEIKKDSKTIAQQKEVILNEIEEKYGVPSYKMGPVTITDSSSDYKVSVVKLIYKDKIILEYSVFNTLQSIKIENVGVKISLSTNDLKTEEMISCDSISKNETGKVIIILKNIGTKKYPTFVCTSELIYTSVELDEKGNETGRCSDSYHLPIFRIAIKDYVKANKLNEEEFDKQWKKLEGKELAQNYQVAYKSKEDAISSLPIYFGMNLCNPNSVIQGNSKIAQLLLSGIVDENIIILAIIKIKMEPKYGCVLNVTSKSNDEELTSLILESIS